METKIFTSLACEAAVTGAFSWAFSNPSLFKFWVAKNSIFETAKVATSIADHILPEKTPRQWKMGIGFSVAIPIVCLVAREIGYPIEDLLLQSATMLAVVTSTTGISKAVETIADRFFPNLSPELKIGTGFAIATLTVKYTAKAMNYQIEKALFVLVALQSLNRYLTMPQISKPVSHVKF